MDLFRHPRWRHRAHSILEQAGELESISDAEFAEKARELKWRARSGQPLSTVLNDVYALTVEASRRTLGKKHYPVQVMGAIALFEGHIAEMQTGEGKTLTAVLPVALRALVGRGVHVVTANDYLASRDAEEMGKVYARLHLTSGCVTQDKTDQQRKSEYDCDITYGTASEMGFDFLRDRLKHGADAGELLSRAIFAKNTSAGTPVQRGHYFALIDEADSILIDEARTPLIIGVQEKNNDATISLYRWCRSAIQKLQINQDFLFDQQKRTVYLTDIGCRHVTLMAKPVLLDTIDTERIYQHIEKALTAELAFERDRDYVIDGEEIVIVDEGTGRKMEGRKWQDGLHQAVEAKERMDLTETTGSAARITIQALFRQYEHLCGMTGTALQAKREFSRVYNLKVSVIPTNRPCVRQGLPTRVFIRQDAKFDAIVQSVERLIEQGRAILIGTPSVDASHALSLKLKSQQIQHTVLNALYHEQEAEIVKQAGQTGRVTVATNMAGRGTDILLDDDVRKSGGLHVIATEMHSSKRIDRQLIGRSARQGDPGSYQFFLSLDDELLRVLKPTQRATLKRNARPDQNGELDPGWRRTFAKVQHNLERRHVKLRKELLKFDKEQRKRFRQMSLDPYLEVAES